jgi:hypothetical protein
MHDFALDQEQSSRRTSLRFHNIPCGDTRNLYKMNTDQIILDICNDVLKVPITINEIGRTHPIGKVRGGTDLQQVQATRCRRRTDFLDIYQA